MSAGTGQTPSPSQARALSLLHIQPSSYPMTPQGAQARLPTQRTPAAASWGFQGRAVLSRRACAPPVSPVTGPAGRPPGVVLSQLHFLGLSGAPEREGGAKGQGTVRLGAPGEAGGRGAVSEAGAHLQCPLPARGCRASVHEAASMCGSAPGAQGHSVLGVVRACGRSPAWLSLSDELGDEVEAGPCGLSPPSLLGQPISASALDPADTAGRGLSPKAVASLWMTASGVT